MSSTRQRPRLSSKTWLGALCTALGAMWLGLGRPAVAAAGAAASGDADAALIEACLNDAAMKGHDLRDCGERVMRACLAEPGAANQQAANQQAALGCEKRRGVAWAYLAREAYRQIEARLADAEKRQLRTSQVQFELEQRDLCAATRMLAGGDPELAAASCASDLAAARALILTRLAAGRQAAR